jgi:hypothetical protein
MELCRRKHGRKTVHFQVLSTRENEGRYNYLQLPRLLRIRKKAMLRVHRVIL